MVFYYKYLQLLLFSKKNSLSHLISSPILQNSNLLNYPKLHHHDQNNKNSKFKLIKFHD
jgi:hypothetical protein